MTGAGMFRRVFFFLMKNKLFYFFYFFLNNHQCNYIKTISHLRLCKYRNSHLDLPIFTLPSVTNIHYCTEKNINLLLNTYNFHRKFRFILWLNLSGNTQNVHFRYVKVQNSPGSMPPDPPLALHPIFAGQTLNCFSRACYY